MSGQVCAWLGCGDIKTEEAYVSLPGGRALKVQLCKTHKEKLQSL